MSKTTGNDIGGVTPARGKRRSKRRRWLWPVAAVVAVAAVAGIFIAVQDARSVALGAISPAPDSMLSARPLTISCELSNFVPGRGSLVLAVDGQPLPASDVTLRPGGVQARLTLPDGKHTVALAYDPGSAFSRHLTNAWAFSVDTMALVVAAFNSQRGLAGGEVVTEQTLKSLLGYIRVNLSERTLYLYGGDDQLVKTYGVAVGMPEYPSPTGSFRIITKLKNPIWNPPDSAWATGMGPVPPGPANPLGTRWMGLNSLGIGIHGTPAPSSIGTAASHGCFRMRIPEAEDLFDRVFVGIPVEIVQ